MLFRIIPLTLVQIKGCIYNPHLVAGISSIIFGYMHGGYMNIFIQGISGFACLLIFIKYSNKNNSILNASLFVIVLHFVFDAAITAIAVLFP